MNRVYNASAGTGKTYQVTGLYEELVLGPDAIDPRKILLLTFTENAAAELRMRVSHRIQQALYQAENHNNDETVIKIRLAQQRLPSAPIGTFHSFCTKLLREHALEVGLSPSFTILDQTLQQDLLAQIIREKILCALDTDPAFRNFCAGAYIVGDGSTRSSVGEVIQSLIGQAGSLGVDLTKAQQILPLPETTVSRIDFEQIMQRLDAELPSPTPAVKKKTNLIKQALNETNDLPSLLKRFNELGVSKFGSGGAKSISDDFWELKERAENEKRYHQRYPSAQAFARCVADISTSFQQQKHQLNAVDFDDQLRLATNLLCSGQYKSPFEYVIVDEVQDTSRIQYELIEYLHAPKDTNLIICGDRKQSIYTWRGADPQVMPDLQKNILSSLEGELQNLTTSYRTKAPIIEKINTIFSVLYPPETYTEGDQLTPNPDWMVPDENGCFEFLASDQPEDCPHTEQVTAEMQAVAERIQLLVQGPPDWRPKYRFDGNTFSPSDKDNRYRYADILILLRRTTHQADLEDALRHAGIPYVLGGKGAGLFSRQETRDISLFLNVLTNPSDLLSLIGFLRSPWIGLSDEEIAQYTCTENGFSADQLIDVIENEETSWSRLIQRYRKLIGFKLASELVRDLIEETGFDALLAGLSHGTQRVANLRKILDWLRENERGAQTTPLAIARKLAEQIQTQPKVPEATLLDPTQNAVTIMTVHGSKGLTQRVVFLPDINSYPPNETAFASLYLDKKNHVSLELNVTGPDKTKAASPGLKQARKQARTIQEYEQLNLLYVALTRARDLVITSASPGKSSRGWLKALTPFIDDSKEIKPIPYETLSCAMKNHHLYRTTLTGQQPTPEQLASAISCLPLPHPAPKLRRIPATRLAKEYSAAQSESETQPRISIRGSERTSRELGTLGHAVLEQLAYHQWEGSAHQWLRKLSMGMDLPEADIFELAPRIDATRDLMAEVTAVLHNLHPEFPFVLLENSTLIDGTIDLLAFRQHRPVIYDYKFTEAGDEDIRSHYQQQLQIYQKAVQKISSETEAPELYLVAIASSGPRLIPLTR